MRPDEFFVRKGLFNEISTWGPKSGLFHCFLFQILELRQIFSGFHQKQNKLFDPNNNFRGKSLHIVMPGVVTVFSKIWSYPGGSTTQSGMDFSAANYISEALNFKFK